MPAPVRLGLIGPIIDELVERLTRRLVLVLVDPENPGQQRAFDPPVEFFAELTDPARAVVGPGDGDE